MVLTTISNPNKGIWIQALNCLFSLLGPRDAIWHHGTLLTLVQAIACCLTHWDRATHICVSKLTIIGSDNGLSPGRRQAITWTNAWILLIGPLGTNFNETSIEIHTFSFKKINLKLSSGKWRPFCLGLNVLTAPSHYLNQYCFFTYGVVWFNGMKYHMQGWKC